MISTRGLVKRYRGVPALDGVDLEVPAGSVYGLVGPNGAGKTTLLSILAGLRSADEGSVAISVDRSQVAVLPDAPRFERWLTGREVVELARGLAAGPTRSASAVLDEAGLGDAADRSVGGYSRGMLQRLGLAATVVSNPAVLLLDEPASALDPVGRRETLDLVRRLRGEATVVFSSHILADVQEVSDRIGVLDAGRLLFQGSAESLLGGDDGSIFEVRVRSGADRVATALRGEPWVTGLTAVDDRRIRVHATSTGDAERALLPALVATGVPVISVTPVAPSLEDVFLELTR